MSNKTCGQCKHFEKAEYFCCTHGCDVATNSIACEDFEPPTNGDRIRQGGDYALAHFKSEHRCDVCAYAAPIDDAPACRRPEGKVCFDGLLAWLNAPAEKTALEKAIDIHEEDYLKDINAPAESEVSNG